MERWKGKVAVVTGASAGIGAAIVRVLVKEGMIVAGLARRKERVEELSNKLKDELGKLYAIKTDITVEEDILQAFEFIKNNLGPIHVLVNNAGIRKATDLSNGSTQIWKQMVNTNLIGYAITTREVIQNMNANKINGHIININSVLGHKVVPCPFQSVYPATKHAITGMTKTLRHELNSIGSKIKVSSISPGIVDTEIRMAGGTTKTKEAEELFNLSPKLQSKDVAETVLMVLSTPSHVQITELIVQHLDENF